MTVFFATPLILTVERIEQPSTNAEITCSRFLESSLFMDILCLSGTRTSSPEEV